MQQRRNVARRRGDSSCARAMNAEHAARRTARAVRRRRIAGSRRPRSFSRTTANRCAPHTPSTCEACSRADLGDYEAAGKLLAQSVEMARANSDVGEQAKSLANLAGVHILLGFIAQAAKEYEALLPLIDPRTQPYQYAALLGNYGFCLIALGDFDRALTLAHRGARVLHQDRRRTSERAASSPRSAASISAWATRTRALETLRAAIVAQEQLGDNRRARQHAARGRQTSPRRSAINTISRSNTCASPREIDANPAHRRAHARAHRDASCASSATCAAPRRNSTAPLESTNALVRATALEERARLAACAEEDGRRRSRTCARPTGNTRRSDSSSTASIRTPRCRRYCCASVT